MIDVQSKTEAMRARAKAFAIRTVRFARTITREPVAEALVRQFVRSATSVSANYLSTGRSRSRAEFLSRLAIVVDEADEAVHWLTIIRESEIARGSELDWLIQEAGELRAIFSAALRTARGRQPTR